MVRLGLLLFACCQLLSQTYAEGVSDSAKLNLQGRLRRLANQIGLSEPHPKQDEYEIRIWNSRSFQFEDAQLLYLLTKKADQFNIAEYVLKSGKRRLQSVRKIVPIKSVTDSLWQQLVHWGILSLPDEAIINAQTSPDNSPRPVSDGKMEKEGSYTIYAQAIKRSVWVHDGESYFIESYSANDYQLRDYNNPKTYLRAMPEVIELQRVVYILNVITSLFPAP